MLENVPQTAQAAEASDTGVRDAVPQQSTETLAPGTHTGFLPRHSRPSPLLSFTEFTALLFALSYFLIVQALIISSNYLGFLEGPELKSECAVPNEKLNVDFNSAK